MDTTVTVPLTARASAGSMQTKASAWSWVRAMYSATKVSGYPN